MSKVKMLNVYLERKWSGHEAGETVIVEDYTAESMVRKGYGRIITAPKAAPPKVETADAPPAAETAVSTPVISDKPDKTEEPDKTTKKKSKNK